MKVPAPRPRAWLLAGFGLAVVLAIVRVVLTPPQVQLPGYSDFGSYYLYAHMGLHHGWSSLYNLDVQAQEWRALGGGQVIPWFPMIYPPPLAWVAAPFSLLPLPVAYAVWSALLLALVVLTWQILTPAGPRLARVAVLLGTIALLPVAFALVLGQILVVVLAAVAGAWWLLRRRRDVLAGVLLCAIVFKPQVAFLVPVVLLIGGRRRAVATWLLGMALIAIVALLSTGIDGLRVYESRLASAAVASPEFIVPTEFTLAGLVGPGIALRVAQGLLLAITLGTAYATRRRGPAILMAVGLFGSMLVTPYLHLQDLATLVLAGALAARGPMGRWQGRTLAAGYLLLLAISFLQSKGFGPVLGPLLLILETTWLILTWAAARSGTRADRVPTAATAA